MTLKDCVQEIITANFVSGNYFDSHTVINMLLQKPEYHLCYLKEFHENYANCNISQFHGHIATDMIKTIPNVNKYCVITINGKNNKYFENPIPLAIKNMAIIIQEIR